MGFTFKGKTSLEMGLVTNTDSVPYIASREQTEIKIPGRDGPHIVEGAYNNIEIELSCTVVGDSIPERRRKARAISAWLVGTGPLTFDYEPGMFYDVVATTNDISADMRSREYRDTFTLIFTCRPYQMNVFYNDELTWENADIYWEDAAIPWEGYDRRFSVSSGNTINVVNGGTYKALPVIKVTGTASTITVGPFTITDLSGTIYVDCVNQVVYSLSGSSKVNQMTKFTGDFITIQPGNNYFYVSGGSVSLEFDYRNTFL